MTLKFKFDQGSEVQRFVRLGGLLFYLCKIKLIYFNFVGKVWHMT